MNGSVEFDGILTHLPAICGAVSGEQATTREQLVAELAAIGLHEVRYDDGEDEDEEVSPYLWIRADLTGVDDDAAAERRLRTAISRQAGKTIGSDKHWDFGPFTMTARVIGGELELQFTSTYSLRAVRAAAKDFLDGADGKTWLLTHGLIDEGAVQNDKGFWPKPAGVSQNPTGRMFPDGRVRASLTFPASRRPPGLIAKSDDDAYVATLTYLTEVLGECDDPSPSHTPVWSRGQRKFTFYRMSSSSRSVTFEEIAGAPETEDPAGE